MILAPLRGVTIRTFREVFADCLIEKGFTEAITPFIPAMAGYDPLKDHELNGLNPEPRTPNHEPRITNHEPRITTTPQFIGKDPAALRECLLKVKNAGYATADLNCGCPFPMVRNKGRGSGLLQHPEVFERMLAAGCEAMGPGKFSIKARLGVTRNDELLKLMPIVNRYPLRFLTIHGRIAKQMYAGEVDWTAVEAVVKVAKMPIVLNGDLPVDADVCPRHAMVGRAFIRALGERGDIAALLNRYIDASQAELYGDRPVLGRLKELLSYWKDTPRWHRRWQVIKLARTVAELRAVLN